MRRGGVLGTVAMVVAVASLTACGAGPSADDAVGQVLPSVSMAAPVPVVAGTPDDVASSPSSASPGPSDPSATTTAVGDPTTRDASAERDVAPLAEAPRHRAPAAARPPVAAARPATAHASTARVTRRPSATASVDLPTGRRNDVDYAGDGDSAHTLDLYFPAGTSGRARPAVLFLHGGGWSSGDKNQIDDAGMSLPEWRDRLLSAGYVVASANYRLSSQAQFPAQINDAKAAVRYLRANAAALGIDPNRIAASGESAGAHLALLLGTTAGNAALEGRVGRTGVSSTVQAVISYYAVTDLLRRRAELQAQGCGNGKADSYEGALIGVEPETAAGAAPARQASPIAQVTGRAAPTLLMVGRQDCEVPTAQTVTMYDALRKAGVKTQLQQIDGGHGDAAFYSTTSLQDAVLSFLRGMMPLR